MSGPPQPPPPRPHFQFFHQPQHHQQNIFSAPQQQQQSFPAGRFPQQPQQQHQFTQQQQQHRQQQQLRPRGGIGRGDFINRRDHQQQQQQYQRGEQRELDPTMLEGCANLLEQIDTRILVVLRDGRTLIGLLRSVDQFANLVLHKAVERIHVDNNYGDINRGVFIVRGDNVVLIGEIDQEKEENSKLQELPVEQILAAQREQQEEKAIREVKRSEAFKNRGLIYNNETINDDL